MIFDGNDEAVLTHYGILHKSGRYPWGSGQTPHERAGTFQSMHKELRDKGLSETEIAAGLGMTTTQLRDTVTIAAKAKKLHDVQRATALRAKGLSNVAIGKKMGIGESSVRGLLKEGEAEKASVIDATAALLRHEVAQKKYIDVGKGVELHLNVSSKNLATAVSILKEEGYAFHRLKVLQLGTNKETNLKVLAAPGVTYSELLRNRDQIQQIRAKYNPEGQGFDRIQPPRSIDSKRIKVRYAEEGGTAADGVIYVRPGVKDVSLGNSDYAQVRIMVDGTHYLKGMAVYKDDLPEGVDLLFNTNKKNTGNKLDAMKEIDRKKNPDPADPFGSQINDQVYAKHPDGSYVVDSKGNKVVESVMNIVNPEGSWNEWSKTLSSQMLSKQKPTLAKHQLDLAYDSKKSEFEQILNYPNPTIRKFMLEKFADSADASAVHLKAAHLPRQSTKVILPVETMKPNEVYAPTFDHGEPVALVRFPHGHISEIPILTVNNRHADAKKLLGNAPDAIGIHSSVAERLSGADFDGDTVLVIPNKLGKVINKPPLEDLKGFDPQKYKIPEDSPIPRMTPKQKGQEMGKVSNLITDMTALGAPDDEVARAVRHSMVVIDAEKHKLDYKQSALDHGIAALKEKYQGGANKGAATIISRASSDIRVNDRVPRRSKDGGPIDKETGKLVFVETGAEFSPGKPKKIKSTKLAETDDAGTLISKQNTLIENIYANHSNRLKELANQARKEMINTDDIVRSPSAAKVYAEDVKDLEAALRIALHNAPYERQALIIANAIVKQKREANPDMDDAELKKLKSKELLAARARVGAKKEQVVITPRQWEAIQAGAISKTKLRQILENTDLEKLKELAMPKDKPALTPAMRDRAVAMLRNDQYSLAEVADQLGVSVSTLTSSLSGEKS